MEKGVDAIPPKRLLHFLIFCIAVDCKIGIHIFDLSEKQNQNEEYQYRSHQERCSEHSLAEGHGHLAFMYLFDLCFWLSSLAPDLSLLVGKK